MSFTLLILALVLMTDDSDLTFGPPAPTPAIAACGYNMKTCANKNRHHAGVDYRRGDGPVSVVAANHGRIARLQRMGGGDQGMGTNIIVEHRLESGRTIYSSYSHLESIEPGLKKGSIVAKGQKLGIMGGSGYGQSDYWGVHLHFELKDKPVPHNPSGPGTYWGYMPSNPDEYGYHNPNSYFGKVKVVRIK
ncbi:MAG TPA: M23 family metallopeptidase [Thermoanaerobaculia bacterium]|jgi:murein DD-endopeptidase MepM/ murein hydrolase activator NlpD|nr:M23 family metallopeptidase [Thermoanaerobaculia bacterium]